jgi:hypothetical protein
MLTRGAHEKGGGEEQKRTREPEMMTKCVCLKITATTNYKKRVP